MIPLYIADHKNALVQSLFLKARIYYAEPHRYYHSERHLLDLFYDVMFEELTLTLSQEMALMFHDAVYIPGSSDNEKYSGELLASILKNSFNSLTVGEEELHKALPTAIQIINDTKRHISSCPESDCILDLDLYTLARNEENYRWDVDSIRKEFIKYSDSEFNAGRLAFLRGMLNNRASIFCTPKFRQQFEARAVDNIQREIAEREILLGVSRD